MRAAEEDAGSRSRSCERDRDSSCERDRDSSPMASFSELASGGVEGPGMGCRGSGPGMGCRGSGLVAAAAAADVATESPSSLVSAHLEISVVLDISELLGTRY
jgi:hypothetical protein